MYKKRDIKRTIKKLLNNDSRRKNESFFFFFFNLFCQYHFSSQIEMFFPLTPWDFCSVVNCISVVNCNNSCREL